jgi:hypothetical protein
MTETPQKNEFRLLSLHCEALRNVAGGCLCDGTNVVNPAKQAVFLCENSVGTPGCHKQQPGWKT